MKDNLEDMFFFYHYRAVAHIYSCELWQHIKVYLEIKTATSLQGRGSGNEILQEVLTLDGCWDMESIF